MSDDDNAFHQTFRAWGKLPMSLPKGHSIEIDQMKNKQTTYNSISNAVLPIHIGEYRNIRVLDYEVSGFEAYDVVGLPNKDSGADKMYPMFTMIVKPTRVCYEFKFIRAYTICAMIAEKPGTGPPFSNSNRAHLLCNTDWPEVKKLLDDAYNEPMLAQFWLQFPLENVPLSPPPSDDDETERENEDDTILTRETIYKPSRGEYGMYLIAQFCERPDLVYVFGIPSLYGKSDEGFMDKRFPGLRISTSAEGVRYDLEWIEEGLIEMAVHFQLYTSINEWNELKVKLGAARKDPKVRHFWDTFPVETETSRPEFEHHTSRQELKHDSSRPEFEHNSSRPEFEHDSSRHEFDYHTSRPEFEHDSSGPEFGQNVSRQEFEYDSSSQESEDETSWHQNKLIKKVSFGRITKFEIDPDEPESIFGERIRQAAQTVQSCASPSPLTSSLKRKNLHHSPDRISLKYQRTQSNKTLNESIITPVWEEHTKKKPLSLYLLKTPDDIAKLSKAKMMVLLEDREIPYDENADQETLMKLVSDAWNDLRKKLNCIVCQQKEKCVARNPCFHRNMCEECAENVWVCPEPGCAETLYGPFITLPSNN